MAGVVDVVVSGLLLKRRVARVGMYILMEVPSVHPLDLHSYRSGCYIACVGVWCGGQ